MGYKAIRLFTLHVQALIRDKAARVDLLKLQRLGAATKLQAMQRRAIAKKRFKMIWLKIVKLQSWRRGLVGRQYAKEYKKFVMARKIQRNWRRLQEQKMYTVLRKAIQVTQERWRMHFAKQQMKKLKQEAKSSVL